MDELLSAVLSVVSIVIGCYVVPWLKVALTTEQQSNVSYWVGVLCSAAEAIFDSGTGAQKLAWVQEKLEEKGFSVTTEEIESAVYWLFNAVSQSEE